MPKKNSVISGMPTKYFLYITLVIRRINPKRTKKYNFWIHIIYIYLCFIR